MNPGGGSGWDDAPLDIQIPDDARELDRDVLAYHRELRAQRRRNRLRRLTGPFAGQVTVMPLLASILAVCLVAGAMLSVATFSPATAPAERPQPASTAPVTPRSSAPARPSATGPSGSGTASAGASATGPSAAPSGSRAGSPVTRTSHSISPSASPSRPGASGSGSARPSALAPSGAPR